VSRYAICYSQMSSGLGRNVEYYCECFGECFHEVINPPEQRKVTANDIDTRAGMIY